MNRLFFRPEQCGMTKTDAAAQTLSECPPPPQQLVPWCASAAGQGAALRSAGRASPPPHLLSRRAPGPALPPIPPCAAPPLQATSTPTCA